MSESQLPTMTKAEFKAFVNAHEWVWAKTYANTHPHYYLVRKGCRDDEEWRRAVATHRQLGYDKYFYRNKMRYLDFEGNRFWTMGYEEQGEDILNMASNRGEPDREWGRNPDPFVTKCPVKDGYPKFAPKAGSDPYLAKGVKELDAIMNTTGNLTKAFSLLKPLTRVGLGASRLQRLKNYFLEKDAGLAKGVKQYRPSDSWFTYEGSSYYNWFTRELTEKRYKELTLEISRSEGTIFIPNECVIESVGTVSDTKSIIRLKKPPEVAKQDLIEVGVSPNDTFVNMKLLSSYYHWIHSPVSGVVEGILPIRTKDGLFGSSALWVLRIRAESGSVVTLLIVGEAVVQDFLFYVEEGETVSAGEELGHFSWGSQTVMFYDAEGTQPLTKKRSYYFVGDITK